MKKILVADDNVQLMEVLKRYIIGAGYEVVQAFDGEEVLRIFNEETIELVLLDIMMPKLDGYEVCKRIRAISDVPIIMITAKGEDFERILGLEIGADDYIVKPFSIGEVVARIKTVLRRFKKAEALNSSEVITYENLSINLDGYIVTIDGERVMLTKREVELLWIMANRKEQVFTREMLLNQLWGYDYFGESRVVDSHIKRLRSKLDRYAHPKWEIKTVWGVGYKFEEIQ